MDPDDVPKVSRLVLLLVIPVVALGILEGFFYYCKLHFNSTEYARANSN